MKKLLLVAVFSLFAVAAFADMAVSPQALPKQAQDFIAQKFAGAGIMYVEQDYDEFEVRLNNGAEIDFYINGDWKEVKTYSGFPAGILPAAVENTAKQTQPNASIIKAEKTWNGFEVKMSNRMKLYINPQGQLLGQKFDK